MSARRGIIPAYAGNTGATRRSGTACRDHPRLRGEHGIRCVGVPSGRGSSPLTRGTRKSLEFLAKEYGIIPAYAGNTIPHGRGQAVVGDHPRLRGEHLLDALSSDSSTGSSPLTRGTQQDSHGRGGVPGIIPAYAGNTCSLSFARLSIEDHPRLRGEHHIQQPIRDRRSGSSPLTRGTQLFTCKLIR